jgi:hypothetical protein
MPILPSRHAPEHANQPHLYDPGFPRLAAGTGPPPGPDDDDFLSDADTELLKTVRAVPGVTAWHLPPRLRPSLVNLERLKLIRDHAGRWYPTRRQ